MAHPQHPSGDVVVPLGKWIEREAKLQISAAACNDPHAESRRKRESVLRKTTVAYGIAELVRHSRDRHAAAPSAMPLSEQFRIENFGVRVRPPAATADAGAMESSVAWCDVRGVDMLRPASSVDIVEPSFLCDEEFSSGDDGDGDRMGRYLEAEFPHEAANAASSSEVSDVGMMPTVASAVSQSEEDARLHALGALLYELYSHLSPFPPECLGGARFSKIEGRESGLAENLASSNGSMPSRGPPCKRARVLHNAAGADVVGPTPVLSSAATAGEIRETSHAAFHRRPYFPLIDLGLPSSICLLVQNLLECGEENRPDDAYDSLETVSKDLHLLLLDPKRFIFEHETTAMRGVGRDATLLFRKHKLYGRENEVSLITDAFCRVSSGKSEAFFIGGFSGSGKSRLVNSLTARVDMAEGYVLTHKFDQMSKERPLLEVISVFDDLCLLIKQKRSEKDLLATAKDLTDVSGAEASALARLLPNVRAISPALEFNGTKESGNQMNLRSICFTLQRFVRAVSSASHPVMLFLDDLQWCDDTALAVIEGILCDASGSSCLFFVGSYRSNEVSDDHAIFPLIESLRSSGVPTTRLNLEGLTPEDLNTMVSDAMCMFPRVCEPLSDIVFQKTKGNPFFVLEFLRSLVDGNLLEYSVQKRRWVWDEDRISSMDITGNVLHLLSSKMIGLSEDVQLALKVAACFGIKMKESVVGYLSTDEEHSGIQSGLEHVVAEGFMVKVGSEFKFVHDKVREAAYSLIPESEKNQYHYYLGMTLYSMTKGSDVDDIIFSIADQVNHGIDDSLVKSPELKLSFAELNEMAGVKAVDCSDYITARSYLNIALSLLPNDHWESHYSRSLQLSFFLAKSAYACGDVEKAQGILQEILGECRCTKDKLGAYFLLVTSMDAYTTCHDVLSQLGEVIPESLDVKRKAQMTEATSKLIKNTSESDLLEMKEMNEELSISLKFYSLMATVAFFARPEMFIFLTCRMVNLTMKHGMCKYSLMGFIQYAAMICANKTSKDIQSASRIGKIAMSCLKKRFHSAEQLPKVYFCYYGLVAFHTEALQSCADMLRQGFDAGMSIGESGTAFLNSIQHIKTSLLAGEKLSTLLKKVDYYLELAVLYKNELTVIYLGIYRDTISTLIDKGESTSSKSNSSTDCAMNPANYPETMYFHRAMQAFWMGHSERCHHYIGKVLQINSAIGRLGNIVMMFIHGLNSFQVLKRQSTAKLRAIPKNAITALKAATSHSRWNFRNKVHLLEAENFSHQGNHEEAKASYAAAITSARCSRFVHEQGLASELAGHHYKKIGDHKSAWSFFNQAKQCYAEWGSQMKVDSINRQLETFQITLASGKFMG